MSDRRRSTVTRSAGLRYALLAISFFRGRWSVSRVYKTGARHRAAQTYF